jgi:hypothetical protein
MTRDDIIRFGEQADEAADRKIRMRGEYHPDWQEVRDEAFAALVIAAQRHPGYIMGEHWLQAAYTRICTGETEAEVMSDYGWRRESR